MTKTEARHIMDYLLSASLRYSPQPFEPTNMAVWYDHLRDVNAEVGVETARRIVESDTDFPSYARFREVAAIVGRDATVKAPFTCRCGGSSLVCEDPETDAWRPCDRCNPTGYQRWRGGAGRPRGFGGDQPHAAEVATLRDSLAHAQALPDPNEEF